jgi:hypothetical protein
VEPCATDSSSGYRSGRSNPESGFRALFIRFGMYTRPNLIARRYFQRRTTSPFSAHSTMVPKWSMGFAGRDDLATRNVLAKC